MLLPADSRSFSTLGSAPGVSVLSVPAESFELDTTVFSGFPSFGDHQIWPCFPLFPSAYLQAFHVGNFLKEAANRIFSYTFLANLGNLSEFLPLRSLRTASIAPRLIITQSAILFELKGICCLHRQKIGFCFFALGMQTSLRKI
jgi:hypothetical protein